MTKIQVVTKFLGKEKALYAPSLPVLPYSSPTPIPNPRPLPHSPRLKANNYNSQNFYVVKPRFLSNSAMGHKNKIGGKKYISPRPIKQRLEAGGARSQKIVSCHFHLPVILGSQPRRRSKALPRCVARGRRQWCFFIAFS